MTSSSASRPSRRAASAYPTSSATFALRSCCGGLNAFMYIFGMFVMLAKLVPMITAPSVPPSTMSIAEGDRIAMGLEPSMVAPR